MPKKKPQPQRHVTADEVGEADHHEADAHANSDRLAKDVEVAAADVDGVEGEVASEAVLHADDEGQGEPQPEQPVPEQRLDQGGSSTLIIVLNHGDGQLHHRVDEPFVVDPLLAQDDDDGDHRHVKAQYQWQPVEQRRQPQSPGHGAVAAALVEIPQQLRVLGGDGPVRCVGKYELAPVVLGGGVVGEAGNLGQER